MSARDKNKILRGKELAKDIITYCVRTGPYDTKLIDFLKDGRIYDALQVAQNHGYEVLTLSLESALQTIREEFPAGA